jgi:hypothetical protein
MKKAIKKFSKEVQNLVACKILNRLLWKIPIPKEMNKHGLAWFLVGQLRDIKINISFDEKEEKFIIK